VTTSVFSVSVRKPFGIAALLWAVIATALCRIFTPNNADFWIGFSWMAGFYLLSVLDLVALGKTVQGVLSFASAGDAGNPSMSAIQTFYWLLLKLACLGIFILAMVLVSRSGKTLPTAGLLTGVGTVAMIPLFGGLLWNLLELEIANE
jgi:hypothetical protein